jgi:hypothetical protein
MPHQDVRPDPWEATSMGSAPDPAPEAARSRWWAVVVVIGVVLVAVLLGSSAIGHRLHAMRSDPIASYEPEGLGDPSWSDSIDERTIAGKTSPAYWSTGWRLGPDDDLQQRCEDAAAYALATGWIPTGHGRCEPLEGGWEATLARTPPEQAGRQLRLRISAIVRSDGPVLWLAIE